jgi:hypothetical protein
MTARVVRGAKVARRAFLNASPDANARQFLADDAPVPHRSVAGRAPP